MRTTPFAGLTILEPGEPLSTDGFSFQDINPDIIDRLLRVGAVSHRHDEHAALADPTDVLTGAVLATGGSFPADTQVIFAYTLVDQWGGESLPSPLLELVTPVKDSPPDPPTAVVDYTAGSLLAGTYLYVLTFTDGAGGETTPSLVKTVTIEPGHANAQVQFSALTTGMPGGGGWRLYKSARGSNFLFVAEGTTATVTDDGTLCADCTGRAPSTNTTADRNVVQVTAPATFPSGAVAFRLYGSIGAGFASPSFFGQYAVSNAGATFSYAAWNPSDGRPPVVSTTIPGAEKIDADTELTGYYYKPPVANLAALPAVGNTTGDVRMTEDDHAFHTWDGAAWVTAGGGGGGGGGGGSTDTWHALAFNATFPHWQSITDSTFYGAWHDSSGATPPPAACYKDAGGEVHLRGGVETYGISGASSIPFGPVGSSNPIFTLPAGYLPDAWRRFWIPYLQLADSGGGVLEFWWGVWLEIYTDGNVYVTALSTPENQDIGGVATPGPGAHKLGDQFSLEGISFRAA